MFMILKICKKFSCLLMNIHKKKQNSCSTHILFIIYQGKDLSIKKVGGFGCFVFLLILDILLDNPLSKLIFGRSFRLLCELDKLVPLLVLLDCDSLIEFEE